MRARPVLTIPLVAALAWLLAADLGVHVPRPLPVTSPSPTPAVAAPAPPEPPPERRLTVEVRRGDSLVTALARTGVAKRTGTDIATALIESGANLRHLRPQDSLATTWNLNGQLTSVTYEPSPWLGFNVISTEGGWTVRRSAVRPEVRVEPIEGEVQHSLFETVEAAGGSPKLVHGLVDIFASEFDFAADTKPGDRFRLLVEKRYAGDTPVDFGRILVAQYVSDARVLTAVGFDRGRRFAHYDPSGRSLKKTFLRSPLEFTRITDRFSYSRPHPILGGVRPHLAVDYAAPVGTPVRAVADGVVEIAGWEGGFGNSVRVRHASGYETMYNHLSRFAAGVRNGMRVRQRQVIGFVGSTGLSTGPHLDFRVSLRGRFVNPLAEKFLPGDPIPAAERGEFLRHARELVARLEREAPF